MDSLKCAVLYIILLIQDSDDRSFIFYINLSTKATFNASIYIIHRLSTHNSPSKRKQSTNLSFKWLARRLSINPLAKPAQLRVRRPSPYVHSQ